MVIQIKLYGVLRSYLTAEENGVGTLDVLEGVTVGQVLAGLGLPEKSPKIIQVNSMQKDATAVLVPGDVLSVFPPMAGG